VKIAASAVFLGTTALMPSTIAFSQPERAIATTLTGDISPVYYHRGGEAT
jgi:hypothetical protein